MPGPALARATAGWPTSFSPRRSTSLYRSELSQRHVAYQRPCARASAASPLGSGDGSPEPDTAQPQAAGPTSEETNNLSSVLSRSLSGELARIVALHATLLRALTSCTCVLFLVVQRSQRAATARLGQQTSSSLAKARTSGAAWTRRCARHAQFIARGAVTLSYDDGRRWTSQQAPCMTPKAWRPLQVNKYPIQRSFTAIGTGGRDFRLAVVRGRGWGGGGGGMAKGAVAAAAVWEAGSRQGKVACGAWQL
jgi:hypothetical protein